MEITRKIERFLRQYDMPPTVFGRLAARDPQLIYDMRRGRQFRTSMVQRVEAFMAAHRYHADRVNEENRI
jgi:hypothetical protein